MGLSIAFNGNLKKISSYVFILSIINGFQGQIWVYLMYLCATHVYILSHQAPVSCLFPQYASRLVEVHGFRMDVSYICLRSNGFIRQVITSQTIYNKYNINMSRASTGEAFRLDCLESLGAVAEGPSYTGPSKPGMMLSYDTISFIL